MDHVFVYDNNEDHGTQALGVQDYIDQQFVTWHLLDGAAFSGGIQTAAYQHCLSTYGPYVSWLAEIDADEYLSVEDPAARQLPPARRLKAVLGDFRFMPGGIQKVSIQCLLQFHTMRRKALSPRGVVRTSALLADAAVKRHAAYTCHRPCGLPGQSLMHADVADAIGHVECRGVGAMALVWQRWARQAT